MKNDEVASELRSLEIDGTPSQNVDWHSGEGATWGANLTSVVALAHGAALHFLFLDCDHLC